jgi:hypothetical protein
MQVEWLASALERGDLGRSTSPLICWSSWDSKGSSDLEITPGRMWFNVKIPTNLVAGQRLTSSSFSQEYDRDLYEGMKLASSLPRGGVGGSCSYPPPVSDRMVSRVRTPSSHSVEVSHLLVVEAVDREAHEKAHSWIRATLRATPMRPVTTGERRFIAHALTNASCSPSRSTDRHGVVKRETSEAQADSLGGTLRPCLHHLDWHNLFFTFLGLDDRHSQL